MLRNRLAQVPPPNPAAPTPEIHIDLSGLAESIWRWFIDHIDDLGSAIVSGIETALREAAQAVWEAIWHSSANIVTQIPPDLSYNFGPYRAIAGDTTSLAVGGATLALVLLGLRTLLSTMIGYDQLVTHVLTRLIPSVFLTLAYPALIVRGIQLVNDAAHALGSTAIGGSLVTGLATILTFQPPPVPSLMLPYALLWLVLMYFGVRLLVRLTYGLFRLMVALIFGPVALILWAIPQTEWVTWLWLRELLGWATTPLLVTACLAMAVPLAAGREGVLSAVLFGIAGMQAAYDVVGLLGVGQRSSSSLLRAAMNEATQVARTISAERRAQELVDSNRDRNAAIAAAVAGRYGAH
jgi:hypothetical protein